LACESIYTSAGMQSCLETTMPRTAVGQIPDRGLMLPGTSLSF
jgi:hypothetical protein